MRGWAALLLAAGLLVVAGAWASQGEAEGSVVLSAPAEGEAGHYETTRVTTHPDGSTDRETGEHVTTWSTETVDVPGGDEDALPSFTYTFPPREDAEEAPVAPLGLLDPGEGGTIEPRLAKLAFHYTQLPGGASLTTTERVVDDDENGDVHIFEHVTRTEGGCAGQRTAWLVDRTPAAAEAAIATCLAETLDLGAGEVSTTSTWETHPDHGRVWVLEAETTDRGPDGQGFEARLELVTSPSLALELEETLAWTQPSPEGTIEHHQTERLVGYDPGEGPLAAEGAQLAEAPTIPLTRWSAEGPAEGGAQAYPFPEAREDARGHPRAEAYHEDHPGATLYKATLVDRGQDEAIEHAAPRGCAPGDGAETADDHPQVPRHGWRFHWTGDGEHLIAAVDRPQAAGPLADLATSVDRHATTFPAEGPLPGLELPREGPRLASLWDHIDEVDHHLEDATPFVRVRAPWHGDADDPLVGVVGKLTCRQDPITGGAERTEVGVRFVDGQLTAAFGMAFRDEGQMTFDVSHLAPPEADGPDESWSPPALGLAGVAVVAGGLAISVGARGVANLYTRLTGREVLEHETRRRLVDAVTARPGTTLNELSTELAVHPATLEHHLRILEREEWIELVRAPAGIVALPIGHPLGERAGVLARRNVRPILAHLQANPGANVSELAEALDVSKGHASRLVGELAEAGLVDRVRDGRSVRLSLTEQAASVVG